MFDISDISKKLKAARLYRGYKTQARLTRALNIPKQSWSIWEKGDSLPSINFITSISNFLHISPLFFFIDGDLQIEKYDLLHDYSAGFHMPFTKTHISGQIEKILNLAIKQLGLYFIATPGGNGITRAVYEWQSISQNDSLIIHDNIEPAQIAVIREKITIPPEKSTIVIGDFALIQQLKHAVNYDFKQLVTDCLGHADFLNIIRKAIPGATLEIITLVMTETCFSLPKLSLLVNSIAQESLDPRWQLNFDSLLFLCKKITYKLKKEACNHENNYYAIKEKREKGTMAPPNALSD